MTLCQATTSSGVNEQPEDKAAPKGPPSSFVQHDEKVFKRRTTSASVLATRKDSLSSRAITTRSSVTWERLVRLTNFGLRPIRATRFLWTCRAPFTQSSDNYDKALAIERDAFRRDPGYGYHNLVASYLSLNRLEEAQATAEEARARNSDSLTSASASTRLPSCEMTFREWHGKWPGVQANPDSKTCYWT